MCKLECAFAYSLWKVLLFFSTIELSGKGFFNASKGFFFLCNLCSQLLEWLLVSTFIPARSLSFPVYTSIFVRIIYNIIIIINIIFELTPCLKWYFQCNCRTSKNLLEVESPQSSQCVLVSVSLPLSPFLSVSFLKSLFFYNFIISLSIFPFFYIYLTFSFQLCCSAAIYTVFSSIYSLYTLFFIRSILLFSFFSSSLYHLLFFLFLNFSLSSLFYAGFFFVYVAFSLTKSMIYKSLHLYVPSIIRTLCPSLSLSASLCLPLTVSLYLFLTHTFHLYLSPLPLSTPSYLPAHVDSTPDARAKSLQFAQRLLPFPFPLAARCTLHAAATRYCPLSTACLHIPVFRCPPPNTPVSPLALPAHCRLAHKSFKIKW